MKCYLDNAATTKLSLEMKDYLISVLDVFGNPSSAHSEGVRSNTLIETVRDRTAKFINAESSDNIYFTSSGSASNTLGIQGFCLDNKYTTILYSPTVHKSILKTIYNLSKHHNIDAGMLEVDSKGNIDTNHLKYAMQTGCYRKLVVVDYANSELGTIQNIKEIANIVHPRGSYTGNKLFVDCTGSISSIPLDVSGLNIDMASFSAHKIGALKGVGVLYKKENIEIVPLIFGSQEQGLFGGTENLLGILSLGKAIELIKYDKTSRNRDYVWDSIKDMSDISLVGASLDENRLINNLYICIKGVNGNDVVAMMDDVYKTQVSTGSACNNGTSLPSPTALAIGLSEEDANSCIRISFSGNETEEELQAFCKNLCTCVEMLKSF